MDYRRIYDDFIKSRREREGLLTGYRERHHILPRCLEGGNEPENLIDLTPEDHFFAHLLLAKTHGGRMWAPIAFMVGGSRKDYRPIVSRSCYGWASRAAGRAAQGRGAHQFDWQKYRLRHRDGHTWAGLQAEMPDQLGLSRSLANMLIKGRVRSARGWCIDGPGARFSGKGASGDEHPAYRREEFTFRHVDGRVFRGTQFALQCAHGVSSTGASNLVRGKAASARGWVLDGKALPTKGRPAHWRKALIAGLSAT